MQRRKFLLTTAGTAGPAAPYMLMPDHMPQHPDDPLGRQGFAYGFGYIKGILQTLEAA